MTMSNKPVGMIARMWEAEDGSYLVAVYQEGNAVAKVSSYKKNGLVNHEETGLLEAQISAIAMRIIGYLDHSSWVPVKRLYVDCAKVLRVGSGWRDKTYAKDYVFKSHSEGRYALDDNGEYKKLEKTGK